MSMAAVEPARDHAQPPIGTVHLVYPHRDRISAPDSIGREVGKRLERRFRVAYHDWGAHHTIEPEPGDVLLGHPHPDANTVFRQSLGRPGWRRRLMLAPFHHGDLRQVAFEDGVVRRCDRFLAITGPYWFRTAPASSCSHWLPKMTHVDMAVDRGDFPPIKPGFSPAGSRRVLYVGHTRWMKNTPYLSEMADLLPGVDFAWIGEGHRPIRGLAALGQLDFATVEGRQAVAQYDILLMVSTADANPTTILEAMAWGLIPVCTPQCGYDDIPSLPNVPLGDARTAVEVLKRLQAAPEAELMALQVANRRLLDEHYNWDRFADQVVEAIESDGSPLLGHESLARRALFVLDGLRSPYGRWGRLAARCGRALHRLRRL